jgi:hypothetical protein
MYNDVVLSNKSGGISMIQITSKDYDDVLDSYHLTGYATYYFALEKLFPLIDRYDQQRKIQDEGFYKRLREDIVEGCIMPPITIAFVDSDIKTNCESDYLQIYINDNIEKAYILDGIQRLNALKKSSVNNNFPNEKNLYINFIISKSQDKLLYRMITLNNGQKPMTPRHQLEILSQELFDFSELKNMNIRTEKELSIKRELNCFKFSEITKAYLAFLTNNVNNENTKIISEEMDKIIVKRIMDQGVPEGKLLFKDVLKDIDDKCYNVEICDWFRVENNIIGYCVGVKEYFITIKELSIETFLQLISNFEQSFKIINVSKIRLGQMRRELVKQYFLDFQIIKSLSLEELKDYIVQRA